MEIRLYWKRTLKRLEVSSRSLMALVEPGSCFAGLLLELVLAADRVYMLNGVFEESELPPAHDTALSVELRTVPDGEWLDAPAKPISVRS